MTHEKIITTQQLLHYRWTSQKADETRDRWIECFSWYPIEQAQHYKRYGEIYKESIAKYGEKKFDYYAKRHRLRKSLTSTDPCNEQVEGDDAKRLSNGVGHLDNYKPSVTTNGEYGLIPPNRLFDCFHST